MPRVLVIDAGAPVVDLPAALDHLKVDNGAEDTLIEGMIAAATGHVEEFTQRAIGVQMLEARFDVFETCGTLRLPRPPVIDLVSISWRRADRELVAGNLADVEVAGRDVYPISTAPWSGLYVGQDALRVRYRAGYEVAPEALRSAILLMTSFLYHNRGSQTAEPPAAVAVLLQPFKVFA